MAIITPATTRRSAKKADCADRGSGKATGSESLPEAGRPVVPAIGEYVAEASQQFLNVHRMLQQAKEQAGTGKKFDAGDEFAREGGYAVECDEVDRYWRCLADTISAVHREQVHMLWAIEEMRSSYILRQVCPEDPVRLRVPAMGHRTSLPRSI